MPRRGKKFRRSNRQNGLEWHEPCGSIKHYWIYSSVSKLPKYISNRTCPLRGYAIPNLKHITRHYLRLNPTKKTIPNFSLIIGVYDTI